MPRVLTRDEVRDRLLHHIWTMIGYWYKESRQSDPREKMEGLAFSILVMLDGYSSSIPSFSVCPAPHLDDKAYRQNQDENWWPEEQDRCNIAGGLHDEFYEFGRKHGYVKE